MGIFWKYFKSTCQWIFIQQSGPISAIAEGGSMLLDAAREAILWLRDQFNPATSETDFTGNHAESRNIKVLAGETDEQFLSRIIYALLWFRRAGKKPGMKDNFEVIGWPGTEIINCRDEDPERWAEFKLDLNAEGKTVSPENIETIIEMTNDQKPARSKLAGITLNDSMIRNDYFAGMMLSAGTSELKADSPIIYQDSFLVDGGLIGTNPPVNKHNPSALYTGRGVSVSDGCCVVSKNKNGNGIFIDIGSAGVETARRMTFDFAEFYTSDNQFKLEAWMMIGHDAPVYSIYDGSAPWITVGTNMIVKYVGNAYTKIDIYTGIIWNDRTQIIDIDFIDIGTNTASIIVSVNGVEKAAFNVGISPLSDRVCGFVSTYENQDMKLNELKIEAI